MAGLAFDLGSYLFPFYSKDGQMSNASAEAAMTAAGEAEATGAKAAAGASEAAAAAPARVQPPRPSNWGNMSKLQKKNWFHRHGKWSVD